MRAEQEGSSGSAAALGPIQTENNYFTPTHPVDVSDRGVTSQGEVYSDPGKVPFEGTVISPDGSVSLTPAQRKVLAGTATAFVGLTVAGALGAYKAGTVEAADIHEAVTTSPTPRTATFEGHQNPYSHLFSTEKVQPKATPTAQPPKEEDTLRKPGITPLEIQMGDGGVQEIGVTVQNIEVPRQQLVPVNVSAMHLIKDQQTGLVQEIIVTARFYQNVAQETEQMSMFSSKYDQATGRMQAWTEESGPAPMAIHGVVGRDNWRIQAGETGYDSFEPKLRVSTNKKDYSDVTIKSHDGSKVITIGKVIGGEQVKGTNKVILGMESIETDGSMLLVDLDTVGTTKEAKLIKWDNPVTMRGPITVGHISADKKIATVYALAHTPDGDEGYVRAEVNLETGVATVKHLAKQYRADAFLPLEDPNGVSKVVMVDNRPSRQVVATLDAASGNKISEISFAGWARRFPESTGFMRIKSIQIVGDQYVAFVSYTGTGDRMILGRASWPINVQPTAESIDIGVIETQQGATVRLPEHTVKGNFAGTEAAVVRVQDLGLTMYDAKNPTAFKWIDKDLGGRYDALGQRPTATPTVQPTATSMPTPEPTASPRPTATATVVDTLKRPFKAFLATVRR